MKNAIYQRKKLLCQRAEGAVLGMAPANTAMGCSGQATGMQADAAMVQALVFLKALIKLEKARTGQCVPWCTTVVLTMCAVGAGVHCQA